jgi:ribosomal protein L40E
MLRTHALCVKSSEASLYRYNLWNDKCFLPSRETRPRILLSPNGRALLSVLLVVSACFLVQMQIAGGQSYSVSTSSSTRTQQVTIPIYSVSTVATSTQTVTGTRTVFSLTTFVVQGVQPRACWRYRFSFNATAGDRLLGNWASNYVINFYIMSDSDYAQFKYCGVPHGSYLTIDMAKSYSIDWTVPKDGRLNFLFENYAEGSDVESDRTVTFALQKIGALSSTSTVLTTLSLPSVYSTTVTAISLYTTQIPPLSAITASSGSLMTVLGVVVIILVAVVLLFLLTRTKGAKTKPVAPKMATTTQKSFCINCGAELPANSKFCNKCGTAQS